ncbi:hypothetical protein QR680_003439 [Steinernema hermaphroditum]|uniref:GRAM domain-containing protein n=1 Tax=Steinernema hermaphroditum TaxID=289476 RepID=A0AA39H8W9_9BILA|nr:hypothetical protein QR680_003439 [Steinernema hermaphroditum]
MKTSKSVEDPVSKHGVNHLMEILAKNYDIVSVLAEFERPETPLEQYSPPSRPSRINLDTPTLRRTADLSEIETRQTPIERDESGMAEEQVGEPWWEQWSASIRELCADVIQALSENTDDPSFSGREQMRFSANALKRDIKRCLTASHGYLETGAALRELQMWKSPLVTLSLFFVYFYSVYRGWLMSVFFFIILLQLSVNYLWTQKGINLGLNFLPTKELPIPKLDISGAQLVFDIARRAQILFKLTADVLEKLNSLFMWRRPDTTFKFFCVILVFFTATSTLSGSTCTTIVLVAIGGKTFITTYLFNRFPRLRQKFDIIVHFFDRLPVLSERGTVSPRKVMLSPIRNHYTLHASLSSNMLSVNSHGHVKKSRSLLSIGPNRSRRPSLEDQCTASESNLLLIETGNAMNNVQTPDQTDPVYFSIADSDSVASDDRDLEITTDCYLQDSEKFFPVNLIAGCLILNDICLIFKSNKTDKNDVYIQLQNISSVKKVDSKILPTAGKTIEIYLKSRRKPYVFKGLSKRDQFFDILSDIINRL